MLWRTLNGDSGYPSGPPDFYTLASCLVFPCHWRSFVVLQTHYVETTQNDRIYITKNWKHSFQYYMHWSSLIIPDSVQAVKTKHKNVDLFENYKGRLQRKLKLMTQPIKLVEKSTNVTEKSKRNKTRPLLNLLNNSNLLARILLCDWSVAL